MRTWVSRYLERHRHPVCLALHIVGVPLTVIALGLAGWQLSQWWWDVWWRPAGLFVLGYLLQWVGHRIEGNDMGEVILLKKLLGKPYTAVAPRHQSESTADQPGV